MKRLLITGTGTGVGKTWLTCGLARALVARGVDTVAIKPIETGVDPEPADAIAIAEACGRPELAHAPGLYRARLPVAPLAATMEGEPAPSLELLAARVRELSTGASVTLIEGAGGLLVPLDERHTMADLAVALDVPIVLVCRDGLGVLSHTLTAVESARARGLEIAAIIMSLYGDVGDDPSRRTNRRVLDAWVDAPVLSLPACEGAELTRAADRLLAPLGLR